MARIANVTPSINWRVLDGSDAIMTLNKSAFLTAITCTEAMTGTRVIPASTTIALDFGSISSAKAAMIWVVSDSVVSTMGVEVNDSAAATFECEAWGASGGAGITALEVTNSDGANTLTIEYMIFE